MWSNHLMILLLSPALSSGYRIDDSCKSGDANKINIIKTAAAEAVNIAQNAIERAGFDRNPGTMMMDLFGDDSPQAYQNIKKCYQNAVDQTGSYSEAMTENLVIFCGSEHLKLIDPVKGYFRDSLHGNKDIWGIKPAPGSVQACSGDYQAIGYPLGVTTDGRPTGGFIIIICQLAFDKSIMNKATNLPISLAVWRTKGRLIALTENIPPPMVPVDTLGQYMSIKVLHEMMHVGDCIAFPNQLPDSKKSEQYEYHRIAEKNGNDYVLSPKDKQSNADSYALAAGVWYLPKYYSESGHFQAVPEVDQFIPIPLPSL